MLEKGDTTGPNSAEFVLRDPTVNFAVLECARGGMLRSGLAFQKCDIGIVTNVAADHLGLRDIHTLEELAQVKAVIPREQGRLCRAECRRRSGVCHGRRCSAR